MEATTPLAPGAKIGILGGGQLGQMLSLAASRLGFQCHIYSPETGGPAAAVSAFETNASYENLPVLETFAKSVDCITYEFENVPAKTAETVSLHTQLFPGAKALEVAQDRLIEKTFIAETAGVRVAGFQTVDSVFDLKRAVKHLGFPAVLKTRRFGYDGKGQIILRSEADIEEAFKTLGKQPLILEAFVPFVREVSIVAARNTRGETASYPLIENVHKNHILHTSTAPAVKDTGEAQNLAVKIMDALEYVGVMATEFFELEDGSLIVNEIAPRVHNSGHWTQNAGCIDQFELHIRAIAGWPLGDVTPKHPVVMTNLIGDDVQSWPSLATQPNTFIHLYGKQESRAGRKMGHVNQIA